MAINTERSPRGRSPRDETDVAAHIADTINAGSAFFTADMREDGRLEVNAEPDGVFLVTVTRKP
jgi:hypothetical protein